MSSSADVRLDDFEVVREALASPFRDTQRDGLAALARLKERLEALEKALEPADTRWTGLTAVRARAARRTDWTGTWPLALEVKELLNALDIIYDRGRAALAPKEPA